MLFGLILLVALAVLSAVLFVSAAFLRGEIGALLAPAVALEIDGPLRMLLAGQVVILLVVGIILAGLVFYAFLLYIAKPLKYLTRALNAYATTGEVTAIPGIADAPKEMQTLAASYDSLVTRVNDAHKHDTEISRVKSDFISTAAHQLRTPLTGIRWAHEALLKESLTENQKVLVESAVAKSKDLVAIVGTLLDISAIESGKYKYKFAPTDLHPLLEEIVRDFIPLAEKSKVSLFYTQEEASPVPSAYIDRDRIKWVLNNLVENAITYTPEGGTVRVSIDGAERRIFVRVKDSGIGIHEEDRANIFERFFRAGNAISKQNAGNGLGLYIARTIATDHGGDLSFLSNQEGPGTTFVLSLPIAS